MKKGFLYQIRLWVALVGALLVFPATSPAQSSPQLPQTFLDTTYASPGGRVLAVASGGDFQAALNSAQPGDIIQLQAGATFTGNFTLPNKSGSGWIYIRSSAYASLPAPGTRISPSQSSLMPKIVTPNTSFAIGTAPGAHHYRFVGIEITTTNTSTSTTTYNLVWLEYQNGQTLLSQAPNNIVFDRCYIHGTSTGNVRRGIALNSTYTAIVDSYLSNFHAVGVDAQAIGGWNGPGPFKIVNNYLEGATENVSFGGVDPSIPNLVPSDIEVRLNYFSKPLSWRVGDPSYDGSQWSIKNIFELKNAQRVLLDGNIFENNWYADQNGFAILFTVRNQDGAAPWAVVQDVTFTNNIVRHTSSGVNILGYDNNYPSQQTKRILIKNNLFDDVNGSRWGGNGSLFQLVDSSADVIIEHNTAFQSQDILVATERPTIAFAYRNNIAPQNQYGVVGTNSPNPVSALNTYTPGAAFLNNAIIGGTLAYPSGNFFPALMANVAFVDSAHGNYRLAASSPYKNSGTDGKDIGADFDAMNAAMNSTPSAQITLSANSLSLGSVAVGTISAPQNIQITNTGSVGVSVSSVAISGTFAVSQNYCAASGTWNGVLAPGTHCDIVVAFVPVKSGSASGTISINAAGKVYPVTLAATGIASDTTPPTISGITSSSQSSSSAVISWNTNETANSLVMYGPPPSYTYSSSNTNMVTAHSATLTGLSSNTLYHYRVMSRDAAGNVSVSGELSFTTLQ